MNSSSHSSRRGQTLVEALVALSILTTGFIGIATLLTKSFQLYRTTMYNTQGTYLAAEGIELAKNLIDHDVYAAPKGTNDFGNCFPQQGYYYPIDYRTTDCTLLGYQPSPPSGINADLSFNSSTHLFSFAPGGVPTIFSRTIKVTHYPTVGTPIDLDVQSTVTWNNGGVSDSITLEDRFYNWHPTQSSGGTGGGGGTGGTGGGSIPSNAITVSNLDEKTNWGWQHDPGTPNTSFGTSAIVSTPLYNPSLDALARKFNVTYTNKYAGELFHLTFANDPNATHFIYKLYVYLANPASVENLELDMNQVLSNKKLVIYGTQCASGSGTWEYTYAGGWHPSNILCNPKALPAGWNSIQIATQRDSAGVVTYDWVNVNGTQTNFINAVSGPAFPPTPPWLVGTLLINFQLDGALTGGGTITAYADKMAVVRW